MSSEMEIWREIDSLHRRLSSLQTRFESLNVPATFPVSEKHSSREDAPVIDTTLLARIEHLEAAFAARLFNSEAKFEDALSFECVGKKA